MLIWVYVDSIPLDEPGKAEGGAVRLPDRVLVREALICGDGPGSVAENVWFPMIVRRLYVWDIREEDVSVRREISLVCFASFRGRVTRSAGVETTEYTLIVSVPPESDTRRLVARRRRPVTAVENDLLEAREGVRVGPGWTWKFEEERRP